MHPDSILQRTDASQDSISIYRGPFKVARAELLGDVYSNLPVGRDLGCKLRRYTTIFTYGNTV